MITTLLSPEHTVAGRIAGAWSHGSRAARWATALACGATVVVVGVAETSVVVAAGLLLAGLAFVAGALVDTVEHRIPNALMAAACVATLVSLVVSWRWSEVATALLGAVVTGGAMLIVRLGRGVGMGDVKMAGAVGLSSGSVALIAAPLALALAALGAASFGFVTRRQKLPLGPALWCGWAASVVMVGMGVVS